MQLKESEHMPTNEAKKQYDLQYAKDKLKRIPLDVKKAKYEEIKAAASTAGEPINGYIKKAIDERMQRDSILFNDTPVASIPSQVRLVGKESNTVPQPDAPIRETLNGKLKRLRSEHSTQITVSSHE